MPEVVVSTGGKTDGRTEARITVSRTRTLDVGENALIYVDNIRYHGEVRSG